MLGSSLEVMGKERLAYVETARPRSPVRASACYLLSAASPFVGFFHEIRFS